MNSEKSYEVGYKQPPKHSQYKPGQSGNPAGRPKGSKNKSAVLEEALAEEVEVREGGKVKTVTKELAMWMSAIASSMKGDFRYTKFIFEHRLKLEAYQANADFWEMMGNDWGDEAVRKAKLSGALPASNSEEDLYAWAERKGRIEPGTYAMFKRVDAMFAAEKKTWSDGS